MDPNDEGGQGIGEERPWLDDIKVRVQHGLAGDFKDSSWTAFIEKVALFLRKLPDDDCNDEVVACISGLIKFGIKNDKQLRDVSQKTNRDDRRDHFEEKFNKKGMPSALANILFDRFVSPPTQVAAAAADNEQAVQLFVTDGISFAGHYLKRKELVQSVKDTATESQFVVVGSPPATGKTSLMQLVGVELETARDKVVYLRARPRGVTKLFSDLKSGAGIDFDDKDGTIDALRNVTTVWILIDDAQNVYSKEYWDFWECLVKGIHPLLGDTANKIRCVIAATYDLSTQVSPVQFEAIPHVPSRGSRLLMSCDEADELYAYQAKDRDWASWVEFKETLMLISNGHIGVFMQGLRMLEEMRVAPPRQLFQENDALTWLRGRKFFALLGRCFPDPGVILNEQWEHVLNAIVQAVVRKPSDDDAMEIDGVGENESILAHLRRGGILDSGGNFTCLAAEWYYYNKMFPDRARNPPVSLESLVRDAVSSMSATRLRAACDGGFPKEAAFQQLFNEAMSRQLPRRNIIIPELKTHAVINGEMKSGELDFFINGELQWALEILRNGETLGEHIGRFHPTTGKYRNVQAHAFLIVDCRGPKVRTVQQVKDRCTLYFSEDFKKCTCAMRNEEEVELILQE